MDAFMAFPVILLAIGITAALGPGSINAVIALAAVYTPRTARIVRASVLVVREMEYVQAARACGAGDWRILLPPHPAQLHGAPDRPAHLHLRLRRPLRGGALLPRPRRPAAHPTWGNIIAEGRQYIREAPWITLIPGSCSPPPCSASTSWATGCATSSTRAQGAAVSGPCCACAI
jgi:peptide/nickel transport system permease protein